MDVILFIFVVIPLSIGAIGLALFVALMVVGTALNVVCVIADLIWTLLGGESFYPADEETEEQ